jgi:hypothetical protein
MGEELNVIAAKLEARFSGLQKYVPGCDTHLAITAMDEP